MKKLGFGMMRLPTTDPQDRSAVDYEKVKELVDAYMERGFNYFDTAFKYCGGNSEIAVRKAVVDRYPGTAMCSPQSCPTNLCALRRSRRRLSASSWKNWEWSMWTTTCSTTREP